MVNTRFAPGFLSLLLAASALSAEDVFKPPPGRWPSFRGTNSTGIADCPMPVVSWNVAKNENVLWKTPIPGLAHSCPIIWDGRVFVTTAISSDAKPEFITGREGGAGKPSGDTSKHIWRVYCLDLHSGKIVWEKTACEGVPKIKRHPKSTQANATPATDGKHLIVYFASEGLYCYDLDGKLLWKKDLGVIDTGAFDNTSLQWGAASSPIIWKDLVILQADQRKGAFLAAFEVETGKEAWRVTREEYASWSTPVICETKNRVELITSSPKFSRGQDPKTGKELWKLGSHSAITVPTPIVGRDLIFLADGYVRPGPRPIYAIRPGGTGDLTLPEGKETNDSVVWSRSRGGPYIPTPILYGDYLYVCNNIGVLTCYEANSGKQVYEKRLGGMYSASAVAADGKLFFTSEDGEVRVVKAGPEFELLATNPTGEACLATPAIADGILVIRGLSAIYAIGSAAVPKPDRSR